MAGGRKEGERVRAGASHTHTHTHYLAHTFMGLGGRGENGSIGRSRVSTVVEHAQKFPLFIYYYYYYYYSSPLARDRRSRETRFAESNFRGSPRCLSALSSSSPFSLSPSGAGGSSVAEFFLPPPLTHLQVNARRRRRRRRRRFPLPQLGQQKC